MSGHTPGPWHVAGGAGEWVNDEREMNVCRVNTTVSVGPSGKTRYDGPNSHRANARVIAAAPELLEVCKIILAAYTDAQYVDDALGRASAAVAKAEGGA